MNSNRTLSLFVALMMLLSALPLLVPDASGTRWEQTSADDFDDGESFFVDTSGGTLKLSRGLTGTWSAVGESSSDYFGYSVASAGDVNGDGYADVVVGAYNNDDAATNAGEAYVYHGSSSGLSSTSDWSDQGEAAGDLFGSSVASAGDVNGDGYADVIVGAYVNDDAAGSAGEAYVYYGSASGLSATPDWSDQGEAANDYFGSSVASAGDVNGDGYADVVVGAYGNDDAANQAGEAYVYYGSAGGLSTTPDWSDQGEAASDLFGSSVASAGDVNGDGYADVIVGAYANDDAGSGAGEAYVYHGSASGLSATSDWSDQGEASGDYFGRSVASAGDVNGDGYADVIVGAYYNDDAGSNAGEAYVYHGSASGLSATPDWSDQGEAATEYFGRGVASAGDVNGDGYADVIVGAYGNDDAGSGAGEAYVYHGSSSGLSATPDWSDQGEVAGDWFGFSVASAGDVNGDGYADVIVSAQYNDDRFSYAGQVYVYSFAVTLVPAFETWSDQGEAAADYFGFSVASAGDVNGDGYVDVIVGAYANDDGGSLAGEAYVYHGSSSGLSATPDWSDQGEAAGDYFGYSVASAGDVNGDGYADVIVGANYNDDGGSSAGEAYVYYGSSSGLSATPDWSDQGEAASDQFGFSVASAGDVNGDGYVDVIVGAYGNEDGASNAGEAYVYHGSSSGLSATPDWSDQGEAANDNFGASVASAGDVNGDGYADVVVGAWANDSAGSNAGEAYVYYGSSSGLSATPDWSDQGEAAGDNFGLSVASAGDVNGDGYTDVIVGAYSNDDGGSQAGEAYVYYGSSSGLSATPDWSDQGETAADYFGRSIASAGDVNGDGYTDVIVGAYGNDDGGSQAGEAYVYYGSSSGLSATPDWSDQGEVSGDYFGRGIASAGDVNGDGYADVIVGAYTNDDAANVAGEVYVYQSPGYFSKGTWESPILNLDNTDEVDWLRLSWNPASQPLGTSVKAQIGTSNDGTTWTWHGPDGSTDTYFTVSAGQDIYSGDRGKYLKVRFILTTTVANRSPTITDFTIDYAKFTTPTAILTWPNGGENLMHGESYAITWESEGDMSATTPISLDYSLNGGSTWTSITSGTANDGNYLWTLPSNENVERALIRITATALDGSTVQDTSDGTFSIDPPEFWQTDDGDSEDTEPPVITMFPLGTAVAGKPVTIRAEVSDETAVTQVALRYGDTEPVTVAMSPAGNGVWEVTLLPVEGELELVVIASDGTNVVETQSQTLSVGAASASGSSAGGSTIAMTLVAGTALGLLVGISRRKD
jgi:hypothetical protein